MNDKNLSTIKKGFVSKLFNLFMSLFKKDIISEKKYIEEKINKNEIEDTNEKNDFYSNIKVENNSKIIYLKIKLENGEIKAIDLTDEQIDELQKIYNKEIEEKRRKLYK